MRLSNYLLLLGYLQGFGNGRSFVQANPRLHMKHGKKFRVGFEGANDVGWKELNFGIWVDERDLVEWGMGEFTFLGRVLLDAG